MYVLIKDNKGEISTNNFDTLNSAQQAMKEDYEKQIKAESIDVDSVFNICIIKEDCALLDIEQVVTEWFIREIGTDNVSVESIAIHILSKHAFLHPEHERGITFLVCDILKEQSKNPNKSSYEIIIELLIPENEREKYLTDNWRYKGEQAYFHLIDMYYRQGLEREKQR